MVGAFGETFVLDWGLARIRGKADPRAKDLRLAPDITGNALEGGAIGTPSYMSPEQAEGKIEQIDERSDVWGLGAVLYELLTGRPPYEGVNPFDVLGKIIKAQVVPVKTLMPDAPGDLCAVAMKALQHDKAARYPSAAEMAKDIESYLGGGNVAAREYRSFELILRFARRNRALLTVATAAAAVLIAFAGYSYKRVKAERDQAREFAQLFLDDVSNKLAPVQGAAPLVEELSTRALDYYRREVDPRNGPRDERLRLGRAWMKIGGLSYQLGKNDEAMRAFQFAVDVARPLVEEKPDDASGIVLLSRALDGMSNTLLLQNESEHSGTVMNEALELAAKAAALAPADDDALSNYSSTLGSMGLLLNSRGDRRGAAPYAVKQLEIDRSRLALKPDDPDIKGNVARALLDLTDMSLNSGEPTKAVEYAVEAQAITMDVLTTHPEKMRIRRSFGEAKMMQAVALLQLRQTDAADPLLHEARSQIETVLSTDPMDQYAQSLRDQLDIRLGDAEVVYQRHHSDTPETLDVDFFQHYLIAAFLSGHDQQVLDAAGKATDTAVRTASTYGALAAAFEDDPATTVKLARAAALATGSELEWVVDMMPAHAGGADSPLRRQAMVFLRAMDEAYRSGNPEAEKAALTDFADAVQSLPK